MRIARLLTPTAAATVVAATALSLHLSAQQMPAPVGPATLSAVPGPVPRTADGRPDLHGISMGGGPTLDIEHGLAPGESIPYTALCNKTKDSRMPECEPEAKFLLAGIPE